MINGIKYFKAEAVRDVCPAFFSGCMRSVRKIVEKKKIPDDSYIFATYVKSKDSWKLSTIEVNKAALLLTEEWVIKNVPRFGKKNVVQEEDQAIDIPMSPQILLLTEEEKFKDVEGNNIEVEVRGERHPEKIFFYSKDIARILFIVKIKDILNDKTSNYEEGVHYKKFIHFQAGSPGLDVDKKIIRTTIFLTYRGLIRMLMTRRDPVSKRFEEWAIKILFTHHLGTTEQKEELANTLIGSSVESVREFLSSSPSKYSELYLICIGKALDLKDSIPLKDTYLENDLVFKFGFADDLSRRLNEHKNKFSKLVGTNISVVLHSPIDPKFLSKAETELKQYFQEEEACIEHVVHKELVVLSEKRMKGVRREFKEICLKYAGCMDRIQEEINKLKDTFENEKKTREREIEQEKKTREREIEQEKKTREREIEQEKKIRDLEVETERRIKEIETLNEIRSREKEVEHEKKMREKDRTEFIGIIESLKQDHKERLESTKREQKELFEYVVSQMMKNK